MIEKPKRPKQPNIQDRQPPRTLQELINRYDLDNTKIYEFLDELVQQIYSIKETDNLLKKYLPLTGGTLTGFLDFNNKNEYHVVRKKRTIDGTDYTANFGISLNKSARIEFGDANHNSLGVLDVRQDGIYNGKSGKKLIEKNEVNFVHLGANSKTFSFSIGNLSGGFQTYIIYGGWEKHFIYLLTLHPSNQIVKGYNQIFNNTGEANITSVTMSNNIVTINFSSTIWGGIHIIGEQAQAT